MSNIVDTQATDGIGIDLDGNFSIVYNANGDVDYMETISSGNTYRQTYGYDGSFRITSISQWVKQP